MPRRCKRRSCTAARTCNSMQINIMRHFTIGTVMKIEFYFIAFFNSYKFSGNLSAEGPENIFNPVG
jgi:hypothetical protein